MTSSQSPVLDERTATKPLRFGIAGLGIASTQIVPAFKGRSHLALTAAADPRQAGLDKFEREIGGETYRSVEEMCKSPNVDVVYVCTPNHLHAEHVITAAEHRKQVIVEKPMGLTLEECDAMNAAADSNGVRLLCGHTHSFDPPVRKLREVVAGGEFGKLRMVNTWHFNEFMYRPRMPHELEPTQGGNVIYNQGPHQVDIVRLIGGGMVRSVRGTVGAWDPARRAEGAYTAFLEFQDGTPATLVYNGYGHFDTSEITEWVGEQQRDPDYNLRVRRALAGAQGPAAEANLKEAQRFGGTDERLHREDGERPQSIFGFTVVSCEHADLRQSPRGLVAYTDTDRREIPVNKGERGRAAELEEMYLAVAQDRGVFHDGRWGEATLEVVLAIMESARQHAELSMTRQVPSPE